MNTILEVKGLKKEFKTFSLQNVSFSLQEGCITGFILGLMVLVRRQR